MLYALLYPLHDQYPIFNVFKYITFRTMYAVVTALILSLTFGPWMIRKLQQLQIGEQIREDGPQNHFSKAGTPTMGGALILVAFFIAVILWADLSNPYTSVLLFATLAFGMIGAYDDYLKISKKSSDGFTTKPKFIIQMLVAGVIALWIYSISPVAESTSITIPFFKDVMPDLGWFFFPFVMLVIVGTCNAVNLTDGLDGLAIGTVTIAVSSFMIILYLMGHAKFANYLMIPHLQGVGELSVFCGAIIGAGLGFLWFNTYPAQIFMGNIGSMALGGFIGTLSVVTKSEILLLIIGGVFVAEALSVIIQVSYFRASGGKRFFLMAPIHHHFEKKGWSESKIVVRFWMIAILFALISLSTLKLR